MSLGVQRPSSCSICVIVLSHPFNIRLSLWFHKDTLHKKSCMSGLSNFYCESVKKLRSSYISKSHTPIKGLFLLFISVCILPFHFLVCFVLILRCFLPGSSFYMCLFSTGLCDGNDGPAAAEERCKSPTSGKETNATVYFYSLKAVHSKRSSSSHQLL